MLQRCKSPEINPLDSSTNSLTDLQAFYNLYFNFVHEGSAEIQPEKAAYIQRNFPSKMILRDIIELILHQMDSWEGPRLL